MENTSRVITKVEEMNELIDFYENGISSLAIITIIKQVFQFDLELLPDLPIPPRATLDMYLEHYGNKVTGAEIREMINQTFGVNLDALSALVGARISIYSKNQWTVQHDKDLFVVHTGTGDVDVRINPTNYYTEQTGSKEIPLDLANALICLGYYYEDGGYYYSNPSGEPVSDAFKGQTIQTISKFIQKSITHLQ